MPTALNPYHCLYFNRVTRRTLSSYFASKGFELSDSPSGALLCKLGELGVDVQYFSDMVTVLEPIVNLGLGRRRVPLWFIIPESDPAREYSAWVFRNEDELTSSLRRIEREVLVPHAEPLWSDSQKLTWWLDRFDRYVEDGRRNQR